MKELYVIHYAEIGLKGRNRAVFEKQLVENIMRQHDVEKSSRLQGRIILQAGPNLDLSKVFGVAWWAVAERVSADVDMIGKKAVEVAEAGREGGSAKYSVRAKVADKSFSLNSQEIEVEIGQRIKDATDLEVDLANPDLTVFIEITHAGALIYTRKIPGPGGLPVGTSAKLVGLFSGGMDSALATYLMAKRGSRIELVHFHALQSGDAAHESKIGEMARMLSEYDARLCVHYVPYHRFQIATSSLPRKIQRYELVVFRRFMARVAERIAKERRAKALFSGDNLGQVASQTLENLVAVNDAVSMPLFRPVIAYDKVEIVDLSKQIGMYDISIRGYKDCCSIIAKHPATRANKRMIEVLEVEVDIDRLIDEVMEEVESFDLSGK
jgi:thiamine biosynthesis protein ThiI